MGSSFGQPTVPLYIRLPIPLRQRLGAAAAALAGGIAGRGALRELVVLSLEKGLDQIAPMCAAIEPASGDLRCILASGHDKDPDTRHTNGVATWPLERPHRAEKPRRARRARGK